MANKRQKLIHLHGTKPLNDTTLIEYGEIAVRHAATKALTELAVKTSIKNEEDQPTDVMVYFPSLTKVNDRIGEEIAKEIKLRQDADNALDARLDTIEAFMGDGEGSLNDKLTALEAELQGEIDSLEAVVGSKAVEGDEPKEATGLFAYVDAVAEAAAEAAATAEKNAEDYTKEVLGGDFTKDATVADAIEAAQSAAEDAAEDAAQALVDAKAYADGLAVNYDAAGAADAAEKNAKEYAKDYADGLASNYDANGSAAQALVDAKAYTDGIVGVLPTTGEGDETRKMTVAEAIEAAEDAAKDAAKAQVDAVRGEEGDAATANTVYGAKKYADEEIEKVKALVTASTQFLGVADNEIKVDGDDKTGAEITVGGKAVTAGAGDIVLHGTKEFIWDGTQWVLLGDTTAEMGAISDLQTAVNETLPKAIQDAEAAAKKYTDDVLGGDFTTEATVADAIEAAEADAKAYTDGIVGVLPTTGEGDETRKMTVAEAIEAAAQAASKGTETAVETAKAYTDEVLGGDFTAEATVAKAIEDAEAAAQAAAKAYTDEVVGNYAVEGDEPKEATGLRKEIAEAIGAAAKDAADADTAIRGEFAAADNVVRGEFAAADNVVRGEFAAADAALKAELQKAITDATLKSAEIVLNENDKITGSITETNDGTKLTFDFTELVIDCGSYDSDIPDAE